MTAPQLSLFDAPAPRDRAPLVSVPKAGIIVPRDYQVAADAAIDRELLTHRSTLVAMATGTGKTVLFALQAKKRGGALVIAHRDSLLKQAAQKLRHVTGEHVGTEKAQQYARAGANYIVASVQTLKGDRLIGFATMHRERIKFVVIDECHRAVAPSYKAILAAFPDAKVLGVTATSDRSDKKALATVFESTEHEHRAAFRYDILEATEDGYLTPIAVYAPDVSGVELDKVKVKNGDLDEGQLDELVARRGAEIAKTMHKACAGRRGIAFCPGVQTAMVGAAALNELVPGCARAIHGGMDDEEKDAILSAHQRGEYPYLLNCAVLVEGYDDAELICVVLFTKTKSRLRWAQCVGRVTRLWRDTIGSLPTPAERKAAIAATPKPTALVFDVSYGKHGHTLTGPTDLLGGTYGADVKARVDKKLAAGQGGVVEKMLADAKDEIEAEKARKVARLAKKAAKAKGDVWIGEVRPTSELHGEAFELVDAEGNAQPFNLVAWLKEQGCHDAATLPVDEQLRRRRVMQERKRAGLGSWKQVLRLKMLGVPGARELPAKRCGLLLNRLRLKPKGYRRFDAARDWYLLGVREPGQEG